MAHRGSSLGSPENTLAAFRRAVEEGADILEADLRMTRDGQFVCMHDPTVDRTTSGHGRVDQMTLEALRHLQVRGNDHASIERVPTLDEIVLSLGATTFLGVDLKASEFSRDGTFFRLLAEIDRLHMRQRIFLLSSRSSVLAIARRIAPDVPVGLVAWHSLLPPRNVELLGPPWPILLANPWYVRTAHRRGQRVCPLDPEPDQRLRWYCRIGCDAIMSNHPATTRRLLESHLLHAREAMAGDPT
jgi:glycerophosphoryl diester phosphodiesterase